jgi:DNA primase
MKEDRGGKVFVDPTRVGGATVIAAYSPRLRPGVPVSFPVGWERLDAITRSDVTIHNALDQMDTAGRWSETLRTRQALPDEIVEQGHTIAVPRVQAMHEGKRRKRARES